jgi:hypothetical protein
MVRWVDFERAASELATIGRERIERHGFMLLGTVRRDGTARISVVGMKIVDGELAMSVLAQSTKERDIRRDPRVLLHSPMLHADDPNDEFKVRGRVVEITDAALRDRAAFWEPPPPLVAFSVDIEKAAFLAWDKGKMEMTRWSVERGLY